MSTPGRDPAAEMRALIDAESTTDFPYVPAQVAQRIVEKLRVTDPEFLAEWLDQQATKFVADAINARDRSVRSHARANASRAAFAQAAAAHVGGDTQALAGWLTVPFSLADGSRKPLGAMGRSDLLWSADQYLERANANAMTNAFLAALARQLGPDQTVADRYTDEQLTAMWRSLGGRLP